MVLGPAEVSLGSAQQSGTGVNVLLELVPRRDGPAHLRSHRTNLLDESLSSLNLGLPAEVLDDVNDR